MKKIYVIILCAMMTACSALSSETKISTSEKRTVVWTNTADEKILQERDYSSKYDGNRELSIKAFRNESESAQIIITPTSDGTFTAEVGEFKSKDGKLLPKSSFTLYVEKYIEVEENFDIESGLGAGNYPDALVPIKECVACGENRLQKGKNQGIYITVKPTKTQDSGEYAGKITVTANGERFEVESKVTVYDYTLSDEVRQKNLFGLSYFDVTVMELDARPELYEKYLEFLLDCGLSVGNLPYSDFIEDDYSKYFEYVHKYTLDQRCTEIIIPWEKTKKTIEIGEDGVIAYDEKVGLEENSETEYAVVDFDRLMKMFEKFVEYSVYYGTDLFKKADLSITLFDEYDGYIDTEFEYAKKGLNQAIYHLRRLNDLTEKFYTVLENLEWTENEIKLTKGLAFSEENENCGIGYSVETVSEVRIANEKGLSEEQFSMLKTSMLKSLKQVKNITVGRNVAPQLSETVITDFVSSLRHYFINHAEYAYNLYGYAEKADIELWCYTTAGPKSPNATYHIDDHILSARLLSWQAYEKDLVGNLYWNTVVNRRCGENLAGFILNDASLPTQDYYQSPERYYGSNGDGYLLYPGRVYGIDGPIGSMRLYAIRDSVEDYGLFYALEQYYKDIELPEENFDGVFQLISRGIYKSNAKINYDDGYLERFAAARNALAALLIFADRYGTIIEEFTFDETQGTIKITAPSDIAIKINGVEQSGTTTGEKRVYSKTLSLNSTLTVSCKEGIDETELKLDLRRFIGE